jgi:hypothetical protein
MALVKHNNNSISAVTSMASLSTGSMTLIKEQTASSSSSISFVNGSSDVVLDSTYPIYLFKCINIHPSVDNTNFSFNGSDDTSSHSYNITKTSSDFAAFHDEADSATNLYYRTGNDLAQSTAIQMIGSSVGSDNDQSTSGELFLFNPSSTTFVKHFISNFNTVTFHNYSTRSFTAGYFNTTAAITAIQFSMNSGNIDSGTIKLYGIKDS